VFNLSGTTGGNHRDGDVFPDVVDQLNIKNAVGTVLINAVEELSMAFPEFRIQSWQ